MGTKYIKREDYEGIEVANGGLHRIACCDCGLVHDMAVVIEDNGNIGLAFKRNNRATAQRRRRLRVQISSSVLRK